MDISNCFFFIFIIDTIVIGLVIFSVSSPVSLSSCNVVNTPAITAAAVFHSVSKWKIAVQPGTASNCGGKLRPRWTWDAFLDALMLP